MPAQQYHLHSLKRAYSTSISFIITLVLAATLVLCSLSFSAMYSFVSLQRKAMEEEFGASLFWSAVYVTPRLTSEFIITGFRMRDEEGIDILASKRIIVDFKFYRILQGMFAKEDPAVFEGKKSLYFLKYLSGVYFTDSIARYNDAYTSVYRPVFHRLFSRNFIPDDATLSFRKTLMEFEGGGAEVSSQNMTIIVRLQYLNGGVTFDISGGVEAASAAVPALPRVQSDVKAAMASADMFKNLDIKASLENIMIGNKAIRIAPAEVSARIGKTSGVTVRATMLGSELAALELDPVEKKLLVTADVSRKAVGDFASFSGRAESLFKNVAASLFSLKARYAADLESGASSYSFVAETDRNNSDAEGFWINVSGDQQVVRVNDLDISMADNDFFWRGSMDLKTLSPDGTVDFSLGAPLLPIPLRGSFLFSRASDEASARALFLSVNNIAQPDFLLRYVPSQQSLALLLSRDAEPVAVLTRTPTEKNGSDVSLSLARYPTKLLTDFIPMLRGNKMIADSALEGVVNLRLGPKSSLEDMKYELRFDSVDHRLFGMVRGGYDEGVWSVDSADISIENAGDDQNAGKDLQKNTGTAPKKMNITVNAAYNANDFSFSGDIDVRPSSGKNLKYIVSGKAQKENLRVSVNDTASFALFTEDDLRKLEFTSGELELPFNLALRESDIRMALGKGDRLAIDGSLLLARSAEKDGIRSVLLRFGAAAARTVQFRKNAAAAGSSVATSVPTSFRIATSRGNFLGSGAMSLEDGLLRVLIHDDTKRVVPLAASGAPAAPQSLPQALAQALPEPLLDARYDAKGGSFDARVRGAAMKEVLGLDGALNFDLRGSQNAAYYELSVLDSYVAYKQNPVHFSGFIRYDAGAVLMQNLAVKSGTLALEVARARIASQNSTTETVDGLYALTSQSDGRYFSAGGNFSVSVKEAGGYMRSLVEQRLPNFDGSIVSEIRFGKTEKNAKTLASYTVYMQNTRDLFSLFSAGEEFFINRERGGAVVGRIGGLRYPMYMTVSGEWTDRIINTDVEIISGDFTSLIKDLEIFPGTSVSALDISGKISIRGTPANPVYYGFLEAQNTVFSSGLLFHDAYIPSFKALLSGNRLSVANTDVVAGGSMISLSANGMLANHTLQELEIQVLINEGTSLAVRRFPIGKVNITGSLYGSVLVSVDMLAKSLDMTGNVYFNNTDVVFEAAKEIPQGGSTITVSADITAHSRRGVVFIMPSINFPVLRGYIASGNKLQFVYDGAQEDLITRGSITVDGGQIYYFSKSFAITEAVIQFDEQYPLGNPLLISLEGERPERYDNERYTLFINAENTPLLEMQVRITSNPPLSLSELGQVVRSDGVTRNISEPVDTASGANNQSIAGLIGLSNSLSNLGVFSRVEQVLRRSLQLDYVAFNTSFAQRLLEYSVDGSAGSLRSTYSDNFLGVVPYLFTGSSLEIGKYFKDLYVGFDLQITDDPFFTNSQNSNNIFNVGVSTIFNVELPTPFFNVRWSFDPSRFFRTNELLPVSFLTLSYQLTY